jgi:DNA polymerase elongation subunit (family B)
VPHLKKQFRQFDSEAELLQDFIEWWFDTLNTPDVVTGWNIRLFDIPYLVNRIARVLGRETANKLSPWNHVEQKAVMIKGKENFLYNLYGIQQLDYLDLFKKFAANTYGAQESYRLDFIAEVVLGQNKIDYSQYGTLTELYERDYQTFIDYNVVDIELIERLEAKLGLISLVFTLSYFGGVNYADTLGTVAIWDSIIFRKLASRHIAIPPNTRSFKSDYAGGFVKEPQVGRHEWVMSFDLNSLYPNLIVQYNMSPETIVPHMKVAALQNGGEDKILNSEQVWAPENNLAVAANGACFRRDKQGILPEIIEELYNQRVEVKRKMLDYEAEAETVDKSSRRYADLQIEIDRASNRQMCLKILLNSLYGAAANQYFRYFNLDIAEGITLSGQLAIHTAENAVNEYLVKALGDEKPKDRIIASDTDSVTGDTLIVVNDKQVKIQDYFNNTTGDYLRYDDFNNDYVKDLSHANDTTLSVSSTGELQEKKIKYIMKHKVKKRLFKIIDDKNNEVTITEDHSIIVKDKNTKKIFSVKPSELDSSKHCILRVAEK